MGNVGIYHSLIMIESLLWISHKEAMLHDMHMAPVVVIDKMEWIALSRLIRR